MIRQRKPNIIKVSHHHRRESIKKKRLKTVIHVRIQSPKPISSVNNNLYISNGSNQSSSLSTKKKINDTILRKKSWSPISNLNKISHLPKKIGSSNERGMTIEYHQKPKNKKNKCSHRYFIVSLFAMILVMLVVGAILLGLLIKPKKTITLRPEAVLRWNSSGVTVAGITASFGMTNTTLNFPYDMTMDYANNLYIADLNNHRIQKYLFGSSFGQTIAGNGTSSSSQYHLSSPSHVILDTNGNYYITDRGNHRIQYWRNGAILGTTVAGTGSPGNASNQLNMPFGIAFHPTSGLLYIADCNNHRLMSYAPNTTNGTKLLGGFGFSNTQLHNPQGIYLDLYSNSLIIVNYGAHYVVKYPIGGTSWTLLAGNITGSPGNTSTTFYNPIDVTVDPMGNMYVVERGNYRVQFFYVGQSVGSTIAGITGIIGSNATTLNLPSSVCLDSQLNLYVADSNNYRIQKFLRY